jgi:hypothetical protein
MLNRTSLPAASCTSLSATSNMNNVHFHFTSYTNQDSHKASTSDSGDPGDSTLQSQTGEPRSPGRFIELGTTAIPGIRTRVCKRSLNAAFGSLPPQASASKRSRTGGDHLTTGGAENTAVFSAPVFTPRASMPIVYKASEASSAASQADAGVPFILNLLENALSQDDVIARRSICEFLRLPLEPGTKIANFIEGFKILVLYASVRKRALPGLSADEIFCAGVSRIKSATIASVESKRSANTSKLMLSQAKTMLFAPGTPRKFIKLAEKHRLDKPVSEESEPRKHACFYALKGLGVLTEIKNATKRKSSPETRLSCQKRIEAMRLRMQERDVAESEFPAHPANAGLVPAISPRGDVVAPDSDAILMTGMASMPMPARLSSTENTTTTTTTARTTATTTTTADFIASIAVPPVAAPVAQAEAAIPFTYPAGQMAGNGIYAAPRAQASVARDAKSLFSIESIVNKRS